MKGNGVPELAPLLRLAQKTKILRDVRAQFRCGLAVEIRPDGRLVSVGRLPKGDLQAEVANLLAMGSVEITASHGVTGRTLHLPVEALIR